MVYLYCGIYIELLIIGTYKSIQLWYCIMIGHEDMIEYARYLLRKGESWRIWLDKQDTYLGRWDDDLCGGQLWIIPVNQTPN